MTSPKVQYAYANGSANHIRPTLLTYPSGRELNYNYGSADSLPDAASRLAALLDDDGSTHLADYSYLGRMTFVETDYAQPDVKYTLVGTAGGDDPDTGDIYRGLDRFGRIKDSYWRDYGGSADVDRIKYGYDRNGNRTWRENPVATANSAYFDEKYFHDLLDRLKHMDRGRLNAQKDAVSNKTFAQCWSLDATGNWRKFTEDSNGDGVWDLDQLRTANQVNEITDLSEYTGPAWVTPAYNRSGNMTTIPKPAGLTSSFTATYDAWNRLVKLEDNSGTVAQFEYDGAKRRTVTIGYSGGVLTQTRHFFYTEPSKWQVIEERVDSDTDPNRQFVWGQRYIDDLILRDRVTNGDGSLDERLYGMQDANWNATAIVDSSGTVQERYSYSAYGVGTVLNVSFGFQGASNFEWETRFGGYDLDYESQLMIIRNRVYHPDLEWIQRDPLGFHSGDVNLYRYVSSNPTNAVDPLGLDVWDGIGCASISASAGITYVATVAACVTCLVPGEGAVVGDLAECMACLGGIPGTIALLYWAIDACKKSGNCATVQQLEQLKQQLEDLQQKVKEMQEQLEGQ